MQTINDLGTYTFPALFNNSLKKFSDSNALAMVGGEPITYKEFGGLVDTVSCLLYDLGIRQENKVAILAGGQPHWCAAYFAIVNSGAIAVPLLHDFTIDEVSTILRHAEVDALFISKQLYNKISAIDEKTVPIIINIEDFTVCRMADYPEGTILQNKARPEIVIREEDTASIIYTSGTTGRSKGVELTHKNLVFTAVQSQCFQRVNKYDKALSFLPLSHVYEFTIGFLLLMLNGACVYYLGKPPAVSTLLPAFKKVRPTIVLSVPLIIEKIYKNVVLPRFTKKALMRSLYRFPLSRKILHRIAGKSLKKTFGGRVVFFGIGGAKLDSDAERFLKEGKFPYAIGYGLTETSPLLAGSGPKITMVGTVGPVMDGIEISVLNPDPQTGVGEIIAKGENVMKGYYRAPELTAEVFTTNDDPCGEGWFKTGDLGTIEKKRGLIRLSLKGRSKNLILNSSGENIYPEDIEFILNQHPAVSESLVVEGKDGLVAIVQLIEQAAGEAVQDLKEGLLYKRESIVSEIQFFVNNKVNKISKIGKITVIEQFEKTASQKIKRYLYKQNASQSK
jgi:long-chain acyl-CoA synthetase